MKEPEKHVLVIAGSSNQFQSFCNEMLDTHILDNMYVKRYRNKLYFGDTIYFYAHNYKDIRGMRLDGYIDYGTYYERKDYDDMVEEAKLRMHT